MTILRRLLPILAALPLAAGNLPLRGTIQAGGSGESTSLYAGILLADGNTRPSPDPYEVDLIGLEVARSRRGAHWDGRIYSLGPGYRWDFSRTTGFVVAASPYLSFGGLTGTGLGVKAQAGLLVGPTLVGAFHARTWGRQQPTGSRVLGETGLFLRVRL